MVTDDASIAVARGSVRYAIYFAPAVGSPWWEFGTRWLGRDERTDQPRDAPALQGIDAELQARITAVPRRYGFHATLKAPFRLHVGCAPVELTHRVRGLARALGPVDLGPLAPRPLAGFASLQPVAAPPALGELAAACVLQLDDLRAPLSEEEMARRGTAALDERAQYLLRHFGYPYVLDRFRFHFTLSGAVEADLAQRLCEAIAEPVRRLNDEAPLVLDRLCLFAEPAPGRALLRLADFPLGGD